MENEYLKRRLHPNPSIRFGSFAKKDIEAGTIILQENPLCEADTDSEAGKQAAIDALSLADRALFDRLHSSTGSCVCEREPCIETVETKKFNTNAYGVGGRSRVYYTASYFNHSCLPNCNWSVSDNGSIILKTNRAIETGKEITISYFTAVGSTLERQEEFKPLGFKCSCEACVEGMDISEDLWEKWMHGWTMEMLVQIGALELVH